jgi:acyl-CoA reductase-like NAD-dependent aldehyde dehydrogenase
VLLELGGKAPLIVLDDADLDEAVKAAAFGAFMNQGQICMSTERIIVVDAIADAFAEKFAAKAEVDAVRRPARRQDAAGGGGRQEDRQPCQCADRRRAGKGRDRDRRRQVRGRADVRDGHRQCDREMNLYRDESFGPITAMIRARDEEDAIRLANDSDYGLSAAVFTRDTAARPQGRAADPVRHLPRQRPDRRRRAAMPFGGVGASATAGSAARPASTASPRQDG